jgi:UDP-glucose 6-dehydrogenase
MKLGVIGGGVVGAAMARAFMEHAEVRVYDVVKERATHTLAQVLDSDICFVCLPTPQQKDGLAADTSAIDAFFRQAIGYPNGKLPAYVLRSTFPIGTTRNRPLCLDGCSDAGPQHRRGHGLQRGPRHGSVSAHGTVRQEVSWRADPPDDERRE